MTQVDDDELRALQARAYGPRADIHLDASAMMRLRELEAKRVSARAGGDEDEVTDASAAAVSRETAPSIDSLGDGEPQVGADPVGSEAERAPADVLVAEAPPDRPRWSISPRPISRSGILIAAAVLIAAVLVVTALVVVRRATPGPLQPDAVEIARLSRDPNYTVPTDLVGTHTTDGLHVRSYAALGGLRAVVFTNEDFTGQSAADPCLTIYPPTAFTGVDDNASTYYVWSGCQTGQFPAVVQFRVTPDLPKSIRDSFHSGEALQFVYDKADDEVVVFTTK